MGVPFLFVWLSRKYKDSNILVYHNNIQRPDYLLIDTNCLIHPKAMEIANKYPDLDYPTLEKLMFKNIVEYIEFLIDYTKPKKGVHISIDGVAPMAKIKQQRLRRYKSLKEKELWEMIKKKHGKEISSSWSNTAITPGTQFMYDLDLYIKKWSLNKKNIIYSSYRDPGEGEHKLLQYIKDNDNNNNYVLYGLDADLIFLSLLTPNKVFLLRETVEFKQLKQDTQEKMTYVDINQMKIAIYKTMVDSNPEYNRSNIINDFIFLCFMIGNDFLPHLHALNIRSNGIELIMENYKKILDSTKTYILNEKYEINSKIFYEIISNLANIEHELLEKAYNTKIYNRCISLDPYEKEVSDIENLNFPINDPIKIGKGEFSEYRKRYYKHYWSSDIETEAKKAVEEYFIGIKWTTKYYFKKCPSWEWFYPYDNPPFIQDIKKYYKNFSSIKLDLGKPLEPIMQLFIVTPRKLSYLLPKSLQDVINDNSHYMKKIFPDDWEQDLINKHKYWQGIPILPKIELNSLKCIYYSAKKSFSDNELKRN